MNPDNPNKLVCLIIMDGWGLSASSSGNAVSLAATPNVNRYRLSYPNTQLTASGEAVGLPKGEAGNTETGHLNIGAGRIVYQDLARINMAIADGSYHANPTFIEAIDHAKKYGSNLHLMGLVGAGGVHSNLEHLFALISLVKAQQFNRLYLHLFTDGRDSPQTSAKIYMQQIEQEIAKEGVGQIASVMGRYWAMDRDFRWDRTAKAYFALTKAQGLPFKTPEEAIDASYALGRTDEFIDPSIMVGADGRALTTIKDNDAIVFFNFRVDRPRQLTSAFVIKDFDVEKISWDFDPYSDKYLKTHLTAAHKNLSIFKRGEALKNLFFVTMTEYAKPLTESGCHVAFKPSVVEMSLGRIISEHDMKQIRIAESEKERFVTYYFNGMHEKAYNGEDRMIIPSPKVATYDLKPEMSANVITEALLAKLRTSLDYSFICINFANADMVAHTGNIGATTKAIETVDECVGKIVNFILAYDGTVLLTADHGNAEEMINPRTGEIDTEHNGSPVPFIVISRELTGRNVTLPSGILADIAPTILKLLGIEPPMDMTGRNLLEGLDI
jgi:2,3-bisphosphoglycerate-independent phosphoglycerate mutase